jgi:phosphoserine phosphatase RsbU/P
MMTRKRTPAQYERVPRLTEPAYCELCSRELDTARRIQRSLLPQAPPYLYGVRIACRSIPAYQVGGDYYDFFRWDEHNLDLVIADVSGHNLGSALIMVGTRSVLRAHALRSGGAGDALALLNELLHDDLTSTELFISMFYGKFNSETRQLIYANGGHSPPLLLRCGQDGCRGLDTDGLVLGVVKGVAYEEKSLLLKEGDVLVLYTDGVTEAHSDTGELFGEARLCRSIYAHRGAPPEQMIDGVLGDVLAFTGQTSFTDDVSMVVMKVD